MTAPVGAKIETIQRKPFTLSIDRRYLGLLLALATALHVWLISQTYLTARDSIGFAQLALVLRHPAEMQLPDEIKALRNSDQPLTLPEVIRYSKHPPGYPAAVYVTSIVVRRVAQGSLPEQMLLSAQCTSAIAGILLVFPIYMLGRMLADRFVGFSAALLFQFLPVVARTTSDGLSEGLFLLLFSTALLFLVWAVKLPKINRFLLGGLFVGLAYLVRPEGILLSASLGLTLLVMLLRRVITWQHFLAYNLAFVVGLAITAVPYMIMIGGLTNKPTGSRMLEWIKGENPRLKMMKEQQSRLISSPLFAEFEPEGLERWERPAWVTWAILSETARTSHYGLALFFLLGLMLLGRTWRSEPRFILLLLYLVVHGSVLWLMAYGGKGGFNNRGYVSERHTLTLAVVITILGIVSIRAFVAYFSRWPRWQKLVDWPYSPHLWVGLLFLLGLFPSCKPLHEHRAGHKQAGLFLAQLDVNESSDLVVDPFEWALYYSGRATYGITPDPLEPKRWIAVLERTDDPKAHDRLPRWAFAKQIAAGKATVIYHWPEDKPFEQCKVYVVESTVRP